MAMSEDERDKWEMPKPIFRQTSGSRPKGFVKKIERSVSQEPETNTPDAPDDILATLYAPPDDPIDASPIVHAIAAGADIEPQPDISELFTIDEAIGEPAAKVKLKRGFFGKIFLVFGVLILLAIGFVVLILYLFFYSQTQTNNF